MAKTIEEMLYYAQFAERAVQIDCSDLSMVDKILAMMELLTPADREAVIRKLDELCSK